MDIKGYICSHCGETTHAPFTIRWGVCNDITNFCSIRCAEEYKKLNASRIIEQQRQKYQAEIWDRQANYNQGVI
jgi:hypothetical protein